VCVCVSIDTLVYYTEVVKQGVSCLCLKVTSTLCFGLGLIGHKGCD
jgi:hypothetical protein